MDDEIKQLLVSVRRCIDDRACQELIVNFLVENRGFERYAIDFSFQYAPVIPPYGWAMNHAVIVHSTYREKHKYVGTSPVSLQAAAIHALEQWLAFEERETAWVVQTMRARDEAVIADARKP